jgi:hypothetical protein
VDFKPAGETTTLLRHRRHAMTRNLELNRTDRLQLAAAAVRGAVAGAARAILTWTLDHYTH